MFSTNAELEIFSGLAAAFCGNAHKLSDTIHVE